MDENVQSKESYQDRMFYNMEHKKRGCFLIINNKNFDKSTGLASRSGTDKDASNLQETFQKLGFEVKVKHNKTTTKMLKAMWKAATTYDHANADCFGCAILSHGAEGIVYGTDGMIRVDLLVSEFSEDKCPGLKGKPKIFIIQACRGVKFDHGVEYIPSTEDEEDVPPVSSQHYHRHMLQSYHQEEANETMFCPIPSEWDTLFLFSTLPGYFSWRNNRSGSWLIQALCGVLKKYGRLKEFLWLLTRVNYEVAYNYESFSREVAFAGKKQVPQIVSMLRKDLYFELK